MADEARPKKKPRRVKGCHNCSQRRINCDRGNPCKKCLKKGLECLGLGVRYRFNNGVASRGKLAGRSIPVPSSNDPPAASPLPKEEPDNSLSPEQINTYSHEFDGILDEILFSDPSPAETDISTGLIQDIGLDGSPHKDLDPLDGQSRFLLSYFSENIAPAMVAINFVFNGYRDMILPLSEDDSTVRNAIMAASASHLALKHGQWKETATKYHMVAIQELNRQTKPESSKEDEGIRDTSLCTMLILLIEEMIVVGTDFHLLLDMVDNFVQSQGGPMIIEKKPLGKFLIQQIRKMSLYSLPFKSKHPATQNLNLQIIPREDLDFLYSCLEIHPEYCDIILKLVDIIQKASQIYLARAANAPEDMISDLVQEFFLETATFNAASPGGHILIWPFFIVGVECVSTTDREFVLSQLEILWGYTGFGNVLYAVQILKQLWEEGVDRRSSSRVFDKVQGFIM